MRTDTRKPQTPRRLAPSIAAIVFASLVSLLLTAAPALAGTVTNQRPLLFAFDGADTTAGRFTGPQELAIDEATGDIYLLNVAGSGQGPGPFDNQRVIDKFNYMGEAQNYAWTGTSSLTGAEVPGGAFGVAGVYEGGSFFESGSIQTDLAVDNSGPGGGEQGRIYVQEEGGPLHIFSPEGRYLSCSLPPETLKPRGVTVDGEGHPWLVDEANRKAREYANTGCTSESPAKFPPEILSATPFERPFSLSAGNGSPKHAAIDSSGNVLYVADAWGSASPTVWKYVEGAPEPLPLMTTPTRDITVDQSSPTGHVLGIEGGGGAELTPFTEFDSSGAELGTFGDDLISNGRGIAYNPSLDWVYVSDTASDTVKVFGPPAGGTAPDVTSLETDEITETEATARGTINPQGVPNSYHFEWIKGEAQRIVVEASGGKFSLSLGGQSTGASGHGNLIEGSSAITAVTTEAGGTFAVGDAITCEFCSNAIPTETAITDIETEASGKLKLTISNPATATVASPPLIGNDIPYNASVAELETALASLSTIGAGNVSVDGLPSEGAGAPGRYTVLFEGELAARDVVQMGRDAAGLTGSPKGVTITTITQGATWASAVNEKSQAGEPEWPEGYPSISPPDGADHPVSQRLSGLQRNTAYNVRLVGTNTEPGGDPAKRLNAYAGPPDAFMTLPPDPPTVTDLAISAITTESAHTTATVDPQEDETSWRILAKARTKATLAECEGLANSEFGTIKTGAIPNGEAGGLGIEADLTALDPAQTYCVRVVATNNGGEGRADEKFMTRAIRPSAVEVAFAAPRTDTTARLNARINPEGEAPLTYRFEYKVDGDTTWTLRNPLVSTVAAAEPIVVADEVTGLSPDTTYHYRLELVENEAGRAASLGGERTFTTRTETEAEEAHPPSCPNEEVRAAQHTKAYLGFCRGIELVNQPDKGNQNANLSEVFVTADGQKIAWSTVGGAPGAYNGSGNGFLATRTTTSHGWQSQSIAPPPDQQLAEANGTLAPLAATPDLSQFVVIEQVRPHSGTTSESAITRLREGERPARLSLYPDPEGNIGAVDVSNDGAHVVLVNPETNRLEDIGGGEPGEILSIMPDGMESECGVPREGSGAFRSPFLTLGPRMIAATDASRVYFQVQADPATKGGSCEGPYGLYLRNRGSSETILIDPGTGAGFSAISPSFLRTTTDGHSVYFATATPLDAQAADTNTGGDVYRWEEETGKSTCLTCVTADANVIGSSVKVSEDFSRVYFRSNEALAAGAADGYESIYVLAGEEIRFVGDVAGTREDSGEGLAGAQLSSDGKVLVFRAKPNPHLTADAVADGAEFELYRYDDDDRSLECISCRREGATAVAVSEDRFKLSGDGSTAVFATEEALLPRDVNRATDLYEWRRGALGLLSDGVGEFVESTEPRLAAVDSDGSDVLFTVAAPGLSGFEADGLRNAYDARIGGGFPPPTPPAHCSEDSCQGPLQPPPSHEQPASRNESRGNVPPRKPCRKGKVRRHGRCLKRHARKQQRKRHHKRSGHTEKGRAR